MTLIFSTREEASDCLRALLARMRVARLVQHGFTLTELLIVVFGIGSLALTGFLIYAFFHFLSKFW